MKQQDSGRVCGMGNTVTALRDPKCHVGHALEPWSIGGEVHSLSGCLSPVFLDIIFLFCVCRLAFVIFGSHGGFW